MAWDKDTRNQFEILWANGKTIDEINLILLNVPDSTLKKWAKQVKTKGNLNVFKGAKKPPKYTARDQRALKIAAVRNKDATIGDIARIANFAGSHKTIVKYLKENNVSIIAAKVPLLKLTHAQKRREFAVLHQDKDLEYWKSPTSPVFGLPAPKDSVELLFDVMNVIYQPT
jgi:transposase